MVRRVLFLLIPSLLISACGAAAPAATEEPAASPQNIVVEQTSQPTQLPETSTSEPASTAPLPTPTLVLPTPTETPLPPLELPTAIPNAPSLLPWDGTPTYLGDSQPGFSFRVLYDPEIWALTQDQFGYPAIGHRTIPYCVISVTSGRGLPANVSVEQDMLYTDAVTFSVGTAFENGMKKFVTYTGGDGKIFTGFEVAFQERSDQCLADAVAVLTTLRSVPASQATPQP